MYNVLVFTDGNIFDLESMVIVP